MTQENNAPTPQAHVRLEQAADAYVAEQGIEHSGGIVERAFEAGALWALKADADEEMYEIGKRDGFEEAVQEIDQKTGGDGEYRISMLIGGGVDDERHTPDAPAMIQRIVDRFETLNLLDDATKTGRDQDWGITPENPSPQPNLRAERIEELRLAAVAIRAYMPETLPANEAGQIHFGRALAEAAADAIEQFLATAAEGDKP